MAINDFSNQNIQDTYQRVVQTDGTNLADGTGSLLPISFEGNDVIIPGALRAESYIVSESIIVASSGSTRFGNDTGRTFNSFHHGKVSVYKQKDEVSQKNALYFARKIPLTKSNKGMQILEVASNVDIQDTLDTINAMQYYSETSFLAKLWNRIRYGTPMSLKT